ncbi:MAG: hypothetical protein ACT4QA_15830 [Panacagrimonas sp.]
MQARRFTIRDRDRVLVLIGFERQPTQYPYAPMVSQAVTEAPLVERLSELGRCCALTFKAVWIGT